MGEVAIRHQVSLRHRVGGLALAVDFTLTQPWTVLFAPSGAGKTTVLRVIAGLERPDAGYVVLRGTSPSEPERVAVLTDTATGTFVPPHRRGIRMVAQRPALFPHKDVLGNIRYGAANDRGRATADAAFEEVRSLCRVLGLERKRVGDLSGGERQRVALARALASRQGDGLLLLDEPFSGLEGELRAELIAGLRPWLRARGTTVLMVTHDVAEVFAAGAEVVRLEDGRVAAQGPAGVVLAGERERLLGVLG